MQSKFKKGIIYVFIANIINLVISLFTGFILPKYLSIETYANIKLFQLYITYIGIMHLGFSDGMYLRLGGQSIETINKKEVLEEFKTFKVFQIFIMIFSLIVSILIKNEMLIFCSLVIFPINIANYIRNLYNAIGQFKKYSRYTNINTILIFVINIILLFIIKTDFYLVYLIAYIIVYFLYWIFIEYENIKLFGREKTKSNKKYLIEDIKAGFLLLIGNFCNVIFTSIDRLFVQNLLGTIKFAFYSFAVSVENLMNVFVTPISTVMYNYFCNNKERNNIVRVKKYIIIFSAIVIIVVFPAKFIIDVWLTKYQESITVLFLLFSAQYISIMVRCVHINLYKSEKKQNRYFKIMVGIVILSIILNFLIYIIFKNMEAIAIATLITNIIWFGIGEMDFKNYRMDKRDYIYIFINLIVFLICGNVKNAIIGCTIYAVSVSTASLILEKDMIKLLLKDGMNFIKIKFRKEKL